MDDNLLRLLNTGANVGTLVTVLHLIFAAMPRRIQAAREDQTRRNVQGLRGLSQEQRDDGADVRVDDWQVTA